MASITFPTGFLWGTATASYQIEGSPLADGAAPSIWHEFTHERGRVTGGSTGDVACDHYRRYAEDVRIMKDLGLTAYRFSIAWPRIMPEPGRVNPKGIDFYSRLVDELLAAGIRPFATLFHWDTPVWVERLGGMVDAACVDHIGDYGEAVFRALGDRLKSWITINEPMVYALLGYVQGIYPPGRRRDVRGAYHASHHLLRAHARLRDACRSMVPQGRAGIANHNVWVAPCRPHHKRDAAVAALMDDAANRFYLDPLFKGTYPESVLRRIGHLLPRGFERDLESIRGTEDFVGVNYYSRGVYRWAPFVPYFHAKECVTPGAPQSAMWEIYPRGIYLTLLRLKEEYGNPPCYVTENGYPLPDAPGTDPLDDGERIDYLRDHVAMAGRAVQSGVDCRGYFHWSLMDNLEWNLGTAMRFGLVRTDFGTLERTWKSSARWYRDLIRSNGLDAGDPPEAGTAG